MTLLLIWLLIISTFLNGSDYYSTFVNSKKYQPHDSINLSIACRVEQKESPIPKIYFPKTPFVEHSILPVSKKVVQPSKKEPTPKKLTYVDKKIMALALVHEKTLYKAIDGVATLKATLKKRREVHEIQKDGMNFTERAIKEREIALLAAYLEKDGIDDLQFIQQLDTRAAIGYYRSLITKESVDPKIKEAALESLKKKKDYFLFLEEEKRATQQDAEHAKFVADNTKLPENPYADIIDKQKEEVVQAVHNEYVDKSLSLDHALQELQKIGVDNPAHYTKATVAFFENMEKQGLLKAFDEDTYQEILQDGLITFFHNIVPENPLHNPKESLKTACSIAAWSVLYTLPPVWCVKLTEAIMIAEQVYTICAQDYANMTPRQRAVLFGKTMAEALKAFGADKAMNVATKKVLKIPFGKKREGFHTQSSPSQPVEHSEIVTTDGTKFKVSHIEESLHLQENSNNQKFPKNTPKNVVKATITDQKPVEWANYLKHRPPQNISWKDIVKSTTNGHAKYHPNVNIKDLELHAWKYGQPTTNGKNWKVFKNDKIIGANSGKETCYIRVECSANTIHGHPILESDYLRYLK